MVEPFLESTFGPLVGHGNLVLQDNAAPGVVTNARLTGPQLVEFLVGGRHRIIQRNRNPGPYIYGVYPGRIERLFPGRCKVRAARSAG